MITAGIDMGIENIKVVILKDEKIIGCDKNRSGGAKRLAAAEESLRNALKDADIRKDDLEKIYATGKGKFDLPFVNDCYTEPITAAKAAEFLCSEATCVIDIGADETLVLTRNKDSCIKEMVVNEKCSAGLGSFLRKMALRLGLSLEDMSSLSLNIPERVTVNDGCAVFAELDALSLLNRGVPIRDVAAALTISAAVRAAATINDITTPFLDRVILFGGLAKNKSFVSALSNFSKIEYLIPEKPEYAGALGSALLAAGWGANTFSSTDK